MISSGTRQLLATLNAVFPRLGTEVTEPVKARRLFAALPPRTDPAPIVGSVVETVVPGPDGHPLAFRVYRPVQPEGHVDDVVVVFLHGGGWVFGGLDSHDHLVRQLCTGLAATLVSVDYRLAPEDPYPAALDDTLAVTTLVARGALGRKPSRLLLAGDSAGGNLAAAACLRLRDVGGPAIHGQLLLYPVLAQSCSTPSYTENASGYYITRDHLHWFWSQYLTGVGRPADGYASPADASDLSGLPPAVIVTAALDPLRDEGLNFGRRLLDSGGRATLLPYDDAFHGFLGFVGRHETADRAMSELCAATKILVSS
jgi:acetyl esterase